MSPKPLRLVTVRPAEIPQMITLEDLANRLSVSPWTVRTWIRQGRIPHYRFGKRILLRVEQVLALIESGYQPGVAPTIAVAKAPPA